ncbi:MAG TPA: enoyl-CoA hydratase-related protein [Thermoleophilaceae bacterium]|nr:enoyl-CoA hydratase-related protein [Thermoleophilaceae bacterium]
MTKELASGKLLLDEPAPGLARLTLHNPDKRGALDHEMLDALAAEVRSQKARCVLLTGSGRMFSAGYDIGNLSEERFEQQAEALVAHPFHAAIEALEQYPYPTVAALNGHAIGGGLELALSCDIRIGQPGIRMGMPPAKLGLIYSHTGLRKFIEVCGLANTNELFYVGRNVDAERGLAMGLVNSLAEDAAEAGLETATEIAANAPLALAGNKQAISTLRRHLHALPEEVERELVELRESCFRSEDFREGVRAFGEKRPPRWQGS